MAGIGGRVWIILRKMLSLLAILIPVFLVSTSIRRSVNQALRGTLLPLLSSTKTIPKRFFLARTCFLKKWPKQFGFVEQNKTFLPTYKIARGVDPKIPTSTTRTQSVPQPHTRQSNQSNRSLSSTSFVQQQQPTFIDVTDGTDSLRYMEKYGKEKTAQPGWTDRIFLHAQPDSEQAKALISHYQANYELKESDHNAVSATISLP